MPERRSIKVAVSVLADISLGIYRTPANALKELISNAFDADATRVSIGTGYPHFLTITCQDNGRGMSIEEFHEIMNRIGGSAKRIGGRQLTTKKRPIIGRIGIGILAVAQICRRFTIISSQQGNGTKFEAVVDFEGLDTEEAKKITLGSKEAGEKKIGSYEWVGELPESPEAHYTRIVLQRIEPGFRDRLLAKRGPESNVRDFKLKAGDPKVISDFVGWLGGTSVRDISDYNKLLWELAVICPVPYLDDGPILGHSVISDIKQNLLDFDFTVEIDGLELRKPILFPTDRDIVQEEEDYKVYPVEFDGVVDDRRLAFTGYIYHQRKSIAPPELRGLLIRIRNVAIGMYDKSLLNYPKAQGPRMAALSGEIYVEEGLEDALNVDRNSFRETDPHYLKLQEVIYTRLGGNRKTRTPGVFSDISKRSRERNRARRSREGLEVRMKMLDDIRNVFGESFEIITSDDDSPIAVEVDTESGTVTIYERHPVFPRSRTTRRLFERVLIAYELAGQVAESKDEAREEFYRLLMKD